MCEVPVNLSEALVAADEDFFPNIRVLLIIGCVSPVGSCEAERSFSALRRIKTYARSTMGDTRLAGLAMMSIHYEQAMLMKCDDIVRKFVQMHTRKLFAKSIIFE